MVQGKRARRVGDLTHAETVEYCESMRSHFETIAQTTCTVSAVANTTTRADCEESRDRCRSAMPDPMLQGDCEDSEVRPACDATIGEMDACVEEMVSTLVGATCERPGQDLLDLPTCRALGPDCVVITD